MPMKSFNINEDEPILGNHKWEQASRKVAHRRCKDKKNRKSVQLIELHGFVLRICLVVKLT